MKKKGFEDQQKKKIEILKNVMKHYDFLVVSGLCIILDCTVTTVHLDGTELTRGKKTILFVGWMLFAMIIYVFGTSTLEPNPVI